MGSTLTAALKFIKPDGNEPVANWPVQNASNMDKADELMRSQLLPLQASELGTITGQGVNSFEPLSPTTGLAFVAPPSGKIFVTISGQIQSANTGSRMILSYALRNGSTIGSGTVVQSATQHRGINTSANVNAGEEATLGASRRVLVTGLTPGNNYNVICEAGMFPSGGGTIHDMHILVEFVYKATPPIQDA